MAEITRADLDASIDRLENRLTAHMDLLVRPLQDRVSENKSHIDELYKRNEETARKQAVTEVKSGIFGAAAALITGAAMFLWEKIKNGK